MCPTLCPASPVAARTIVCSAHARSLVDKDDCALIRTNVFCLHVLVLAPLQIDEEVSRQESKANKRKEAAAERLLKKVSGSNAVKLVKGIIITVQLQPYTAERPLL
jgi:hypothetical protein